MEIAAAVGLGLALAIDASVAAFSCGLSAKTHHAKCPLKLALVTGFFQGAMPTIGFFAAGEIVRHISAWAQWLSFGIFLILGAMFIRNAWKKQENCECAGCVSCVIKTWKGVLAVGIATSIDALAVGAGMACLPNNSAAELPLSETIFIPAAIIAGTTFCCVLAAFYSTKFFRNFPEKFLGTIAGLILIGLGIRALF